MNPTVTRVTQRIIERSRASRSAYLVRIAAARDSGPHRRHLSCGNLAHGFAASNVADKASLRAAARGVWASSRRTTTCFRRTSFVRALSGPDPQKPRVRPARRRRCRWRAGDVRWRHAG